MEFGEFENRSRPLPDRVIGDFSTIPFFPSTGMPWLLMAFICILFVNRLMNPNALDTFIPVSQLDIGTAFRTMFGMSLIPKVSMGAMMNAVDWTLTSGAKLIWWIVPIMLSAGFVTPFPYGCRRLKALGMARQ